jgi:hypothetical protein
MEIIRDFCDGTNVIWLDTRIYQPLMKPFGIIQKFSLNPKSKITKPKKQKYNISKSSLLPFFVDLAKAIDINDFGFVTENSSLSNFNCNYLNFNGVTENFFLICALLLLLIHTENGTIPLFLQKRKIFLLYLIKTKHLITKIL